MITAQYLSDLARRCTLYCERCDIRCAILADDAADLQRQLDNALAEAASMRSVALH